MPIPVRHRKDNYGEKAMVIPGLRKRLLDFYFKVDEKIDYAVFKDE
jgi:hypothetical protein